MVFNARYADYVDVALTECYRQVSGGYAKLLERGIDNQVVALKLEWQSAARFDEVLALKVLPPRICNSSCTFQMAICEHFSGRQVATAEITYVTVAAVGQAKRPVPEFFREAVARWPLMTIDLAGVAARVDAEQGQSR